MWKAFYYCTKMLIKKQLKNIDGEVEKSIRKENKELFPSFKLIENYFQQSKVTDNERTYQKLLEY